MSIRMNTEDVIARGQEIGSHVEDVTALQNYLNDVVDRRLPELWEGSGYEGFAARVAEMAPSFEAMRELIAAGGGSAVCLFQENLYIVDKTPVLLVYNYPHCSMSALRDVNRDASDGSFASFLTAISGEDSAHTIVRVQPALASDRVADRLELPAGMPLLRLKEEHYSVFDRLLGESVVFFHPRRTAPAILRKW